MHRSKKGCHKQSHRWAKKHSCMLFEMHTVDLMQRTLGEVVVAAARVAGCTAADDITLQSHELPPGLAHTGITPHQRIYTSEAAAVQGAVHGSTGGLCRTLSQMNLAIASPRQ